MSNRIRRALAYRGRQALGQLWPRQCFVCGERSGVRVLCPACEPVLQRLPVNLCPSCALPTPVAGLCCGRCQRRALHFDATLAVFSYAHPVREMVLALKHGRGFGLVDWLALQMKDTLGALPVDCALAMPLHARRLCERGFNQSAELLSHLAAGSGMCVRREAVLRELDTPHLAGLRGRERQRAVRGAFRAVEDFSGLHVLVVDDVMTSGATLNELARTLKQRGATRVTNLVLARTLREKKD